jgi:hypothetical protein
MVSKFNPAVPRRYLFGLAGILWTTAGTLLCIRAIIWLDVFSTQTECVLEFFGCLLAATGYFFLFSRIVQKNIDRILELPERACVFAFTAWRGYAMIALMATIGITLRNTSIPKYYLSIPYTAMGGILLIGSVRFYRQFLVQTDGNITS